MIEQLFQTSRAPFIVVRDGQLHVDGAAHAQLTVQIHEIAPVRKLFVQRRLECYSLDCQTGKKGQFCELCPDRRRCGQRLQLRLVWTDAGQSRPAILEVPKPGFHAFDELLRQAGSVEDLLKALVEVTASQTPDGRTELQFRLLF